MVVDAARRLVQSPGLVAVFSWQGSARVIKDDTACLMSTSTQCMWEEKRKPASKKAGGDKTALSARYKK